MDDNRFDGEWRVIPSGDSSWGWEWHGEGWTILAALDGGVTVVAPAGCTTGPPQGVLSILRGMVGSHAKSAREWYN